MGARGPAPKRDAERMGHRKKKTVEETGGAVTSEIPAVVVQLPAVAGETYSGYVIPAPDQSWHNIAMMMWDAATKSGQTIFYEPSDWASLYLLCESVSRDMGEQFVGFNPVTGEPMYEVIPLKGSSMASYTKMMSALMMNEADRRRARIELNRDRRDEEIAQQKKLDIVQDRKALFA